MSIANTAQAEHRNSGEGVAHWMWRVAAVHRGPPGPGRAHQGRDRGSAWARGLRGRL